MRFGSDGSRLVTLGDQLLTAVFDASSGRFEGRWKPAAWDWEGVFRVSGDASRIVIYHFVSDVLEVLDGATARHVGYVCPYFCNIKHNPVVVTYDVSPDGKTLAAAHRYGAAIWETDTDRLLFPLDDPAMPKLPER